MRLLRRSTLGVFALAAIAVVWTPNALLAHDEGRRIQGTFAASFTRPSTVSYCAGPGISFEAQGIGNISKIGPLFLVVKKCLTVEGVAGTFVGRFWMTAANGDTLEGTYAGTIDLSAKDENGYGPFRGTLTMTGGTGEFSNARGVLSFAAVTTPASSGANGTTVNGAAYYLIEGNMRFPDRD